MLVYEHVQCIGYRDDVLTKVITMCSQSSYQYITNFEWYIRSYYYYYYYLLILFIIIL